MLSYEKPRPKELTVHALRQFISKAIDKGWVREKWHSEHDRAYRNISNEDVLYGLERSDWTLAAPPDYDEDHGSWEYKIKTVDIEGDELHLKVVPIISDGVVWVITKF